MTKSPQATSAASTTEYGPDSIKVLSGLEAVRQAPAMYIGSTDRDGVHQLAYELVHNAIDETLAGHNRDIALTLHDDGSCEVVDEGRGIPVELHPDEGISAAEVVLTRLHAGGKFGHGSYGRTTGLHGVGLSCVNALSEWLDLDVWRDGGHYQQRYERGQPEAPLSRTGETTRRGTRIRFRPDAEIFEETSFGGDVLAQRLRELAFLHPGVAIHFDDRSRGTKLTFAYDTGLLGFIEHLNEGRRPVHDTPVSITHRSADLDFDLAMQWTADYGEHVHSYVNSVHTVYGGTHVAGLKVALTRALNGCALGAGLMAADEERISVLDALEGLAVVLAVRMSHPRFEGQTKTRLTVASAKKQVAAAVESQLLALLRADSRLAGKVVGRALDASRARHAARRASARVRFVEDARAVDEEVYTEQFGIRSRNWHDSAVWITDDELLRKHAEMCEVPRGARMLDVCCGSGVVGELFRGRVGEMVGLDLTPEMVKLANDRLDVVHQGTVYDLPFEDASFDLVVTREVLHILPWPERPCSEIFRVLKPGGQFITGQILPFGADDAAWMYRIFKKKQPLIFNLFQEEDFRELLLGAGFTGIKMDEHLLWESIDVWIDTVETPPLHRQQIRELFANAPEEARRIHPFEILPSGEIRDLWRWCIFSAWKPE